MAQIPAITPYATESKHPVYNTVKIKVNSPYSEIPDRYRDSDDNGEYNAVSIEIDRPELEIKKKSIYSYPMADNIVTYNMINNKTYVNNDIELEKKDCYPHNKNHKTVPEPNVTTPEAEKGKPVSAVSFHGKPEVTVVPDAGIEPAVDVETVLKNLSSINYDEQALQLEEITKSALEGSEKALPYITTDVFSSIIDIVEKDTKLLDGPTPEQMELRKKIITNIIVAEQMLAEGKNFTEADLPYQLTDDEIKSANDLSNLELAERNKEYGIYTLTALAKAYATESEKLTGKMVQLVDLPGAAVLMDTLRYNSNPAVRDAAINSLMYIQRPEYNKEIISALEVVAKNDIALGGKAQAVLEILK